MPRTLRLSTLALTLSALLAGCASGPQSLDELPRTPQASVDEILKDADRREGAEANLLRLHAAQTALNAGNPEQAQQILRRIPQSDLPTDQQIRFSELQATSTLSLGDTSGALRAIQHNSLQQLDMRPVEEQLRIQQLRADILEANDRPIESARERVYIDALLPAGRQANNRQAVWETLSSADTAALQQAAQGASGDYAGWLELALITRTERNLDLQIRALNAWKNEHPNHPAAAQLPEPVQQIESLHASRPTHIGLLLPFNGPLSGAAQALRDGFLAAQYQAQSEGLEQPQVTLYDSTQYTQVIDALNQAQRDGVQWMIGPLEKDKVAQLASQPQLPLPTLALNYVEQPAGGSSFYQFGLAPEDEARSAAQRAWNDGHRRMATLSTHDDWSQRASRAFISEWEAMGGSILGQELVDQPAAVANQMGELLKIQQSERRANRVQGILGSVMVQPTPRQDLDALFLAATPLQARQIKPTLAFQYAAELPVYATSHAYQIDPSGLQNVDLEGLLIAEMPWLLDHSDPLYGAVTGNWPQASGALGRLYAMGVDTQRVFARLPQMRQYPETRIEGATGTLSLNQGGRIQRELSWGEIQNGVLQPATEDGATAF
ncbi:penicillin-binding protein activator [Halopseudomonas maritima]|uniref:penicillin-binding protein activator n=1 Tax=Halopseudomonas maritima TaxID=2918528 RepID=UPI001EE9B45B|nr:penicillin-binding protein activator [Halopseudomonas maritima]UJJ32488.1 penicillin-binding protein activator [Halopseudomonas maritima]